MDWLDLAIAVALVLCGYLGFRRGVSWIGPTIVSLIIGILIGALIAPPLARRLSSNPALQPTITITVLFGCILLIEGLGTAVGYRFRVRTLRTGFAKADSILGTAVALLGVLASVWFLGITFASSQWVGLNQQIHGSAIVQSLNGLEPDPPGFIADLETMISDSHFPNPILAITGDDMPQLAIPSQSSVTSGQRQVAGEVVKVISDSPACDSEEAGSGWPAADQYIITNAHVVAGSDHVQIDVPDGNQFNAQVVLFDPEVDIAVLYVPGLHLTPLVTVSQDPASGTDGALVGYPDGERQQIAPAAVRGTEEAQGLDIYPDGNKVVRDIAVLAAHVIPGDSGGPLLDREGRVIGVVFASSTTNPDSEGYALTISQVIGDVRAGTTRTTPVSTSYEGHTCTDG